MKQRKIEVKWKPVGENEYAPLIAATLPAGGRSSEREKKIEYFCTSAQVGLFHKVDASRLWQGSRPHDIKKSPLETVVVLSDIHIPWHSEQALLLALDFCKKKQPDIIVLLGDIVDFSGISDYNKTLKDEMGMVFDLLKFRAFMALVKTLCPNSKIVLVKGNHCDRYTRWWAADGNRAMGTAASLFMPFNRVIGADDMNIPVYEYGHWWEHRNFMFVHTAGYSGAVNSSSVSERKAIQKMQCSGIQGHHHRVGMCVTKTASGYLGFYGNGCLSSLNPHYTTNPDWVNCFSVLKFLPNSSRFNWTPVLIIDGKAVYGDEIFSV